MSSSPDERFALSRRSILTIFLVAAIIVLAALPFVPRMAFSERPRVSQIQQPPVDAFPGASAQRVFLSSVDSAEAARRGLTPPAARSIIATDGKMAHGSWRWDDAGVPPGPLAVRVDLSRQLVSVYRGPDEIGTAVIVYGVDGKDTPRGKLPILGKTRDYHSRTYDAPMPFSLWLRDDGVALHGSSVAMGKATNGCIGVPVEFAERLFAVADKGDIIEVIGTPAKG